MAPAVYDQTGVDIEAKPAPGQARATRRTTRCAPAARCSSSPGWLAEYGKGSLRARGLELAGEEDNAEPARWRQRTAAAGERCARTARRKTLGFDKPTTARCRSSREGEALALVTPPGVLTEQKFTQPPPRYNEGSLVRELEKRGIGRPSTYAEIISKVQARDYVEKLPGGQMQPTELGQVRGRRAASAAQLDFMDPDFTAKMEEELDEVDAGRLRRVQLLEPLLQALPRASSTSPRSRSAGRRSPSRRTRSARSAARTMLKRWSKNGWFLGCEAYPKCKFTRDLGTDGDAAPAAARDRHRCDKCGKPMVIKTGRYGEFLSCSGYPTCKNARPVPLGHRVPQVRRRHHRGRARKKRGGKTFYGCSTIAGKVRLQALAEARSTSRARTASDPFLVDAGGKKKPIICPRGKECGYSRELPSPEELEAATATRRRTPTPRRARAEAYATAAAPGSRLERAARRRDRRRGPRRLRGGPRARAPRRRVRL